MKILFVKVNPYVYKKDSEVSSKKGLSAEDFVTTMTNEQSPECVFTNLSDMLCIQNGVYLIMEGTVPDYPKEVVSTDVYSYRKDYWVEASVLNKSNMFYL